MAARPWVTPADVKAYSDFTAVQNRNEEKLLTDISRAELYIINRTNNTFADDTKYAEIPVNIKLAVLLVAEFYANTAAADPQKKRQSETFKDYSYTVLSSGADLSADDLDIEPLISAYISPQARGTVDLKLRKL